MTFAADWVLNAKDQSIVLNSFRSVRLTGYIYYAGIGYGLLCFIHSAHTVLTYIGRNRPPETQKCHMLPAAIVCVQSVPNLSSYVTDMTSEDIKPQSHRRQ